MSQFWVSNNSGRGTKRHDCIYKWTSTRSLLAFWQLDYRAVKQKDVLSLWRKASETLPDWSLALQRRPDPVPHQHLARQVAPPGGSCCQQTARYRCQPDEGAPSWAVVVTLSQQRSYCNIPAIWHSSFSMALQRLNLPLNKLKILFFAKCIIFLTSVERTWKKRNLMQKRFC